MLLGAQCRSAFCTIDCATLAVRLYCWCRTFFVFYWLPLNSSIVQMRGGDDAAPFAAIKSELPYLSSLSDVKAGVTCDVKAVVRRVFDPEGERLLLKCMSCLGLPAIVLCCVCVSVCVCVCVCVCLFVCVCVRVRVRGWLARGWMCHGFADLN